MTPIGYLVRGMVLICADPECCNGKEEAPVYGSCLDRQCGSCGDSIYANRDYGRKAWATVARNAA